MIARVDDAFLLRHQIAKGGMTLIDAHRAKMLEDALSETTITPGGGDPILYRPQLALQSGPGKIQG